MYIDYQDLDFSFLKSQGGIGVLTSTLSAMQERKMPYLNKLLHKIDIYDNFEQIFKYKALIIPNGVNEIWLYEHKNALENYIKSGRILINFATNSTRYLPSQTSAYIPSDMPIRTREIIPSKHAIFHGVSTYDLNFRRGVKGFFNRGYFNAPKNSLEIMSDSEKKCVAFIEKIGDGTLLATAGADFLWYGAFELSTAKRTAINLLLWVQHCLKTGEIDPDFSEIYIKSSKFSKQICSQNDEVLHSNKYAKSSKKIEEFSLQKYEKNKFNLKDFVSNLAQNKSAKSSENLFDYSGVKKAFLTSGASFHLGFFKNYDAKYSDIFDEIFYAPNFKNSSLENIDLLVIASRIEVRFLRENRKKIREFLKRGGNLIFFGEDQKEIIKSAKFTRGEVNFWWWLNRDKGANMPLIATNQDAPIWQFMRPDEAKWHYHGYFMPTNKNGKKIKICNLLCDELGRTILYRDLSFKGAVYITSLDPEYHIGQGFMLATKPFFDKFLNFACYMIRNKK